MRAITLIFLLAAAGCLAPQVVFVPPAGVATRVGPSVVGRIYAYDAASKHWLLSSANASYPQGWYLVAPPPGATTLPTQPSQ